jgi:hypothetical protein
MTSLLDKRGQIRFKQAELDLPSKPAQGRNPVNHTLAKRKKRRIKQERETPKCQLRYILCEGPSRKTPLGSAKFPKGCPSCCFLEPVTNADYPSICPA